jgi:Viral BACON domain
MSRTLLLVLCAVAFVGCGGSGSQPSSPTLTISQTTLSFGSSQGTVANPAPISVSVTNTGTGSLAFSAASDSPWLSVTPGSGNAPQSVQVSVAVGTLAVNSYTGHVTITAAGAANSPTTITVTFVVAQTPSNAAFWSQWGSNSQHQGMVSVVGQPATQQLADIIYDPFVKQEQAEGTGGDLTVHYQAPLTDGQDVYMMTKSGTYTSCNPAGSWANGSACGPNVWANEVWNEARFTWINGSLVQVWTFASDWKPEPNGSGLDGWEPVFHPVNANGFIYVPGAGGTVWKVSKADGSSVEKINPFAGANITATDTYVAGPLTADSAGNIYYNAIELVDPSVGDPWQNDVRAAWLVKVSAADTTGTLTFASLVPGAPAGTATTCPGQFGSGDSLPWPPSANAVPATVSCGSQRPGLNIAPAVAADGTIFTVSRAHFDGMQAYIIAVSSDFSGARWVASLQNRLSDGCGTIVPIGPTNSTPNACRVGSKAGVDPTTNALGSGVVFDLGSSSPTALPDGSVIFGALTNYNGFRGHLFKFDSTGNYLGAYDFGWDSTAAAYSHDGTYSIVLKDNHYDTGLYCNGNSPICATLPPGPYYITQLDSNLNIQWQFQNTNTQSCMRNANGSVTCTTTNPNSFEWCINMPAVDDNGNVYATSEDGNLYVISQGNAGVFTTPAAKMFLNLAEGAAYTPLSIGPDGEIFTQNNGHMFVVGN